jgi:putative NADPH-quinone reductase
MKVLVVYAHPVEGSFSSAIRRRVVDTLLAGGHDVDLLDLYAEDFRPVLNAEERRLHRAGPERKPAIAEHAKRLRRAESLIFVYPTWWGGQPAILKGWIDRVWVQGVAYNFPEGAKRVTPLLKDVRHLMVVTTHGSSKWINSLQGEPGKRTMLRGLRAMCHPMTKAIWIACYDLDRADDVKRNRFLEKVCAAIKRL